MPLCSIEKKSSNQSASVSKFDNVRKVSCYKKFAKKCSDDTTGGTGRKNVILTKENRKKIVKSLQQVWKIKAASNVHWQIFVGLSWPLTGLFCQQISCCARYPRKEREMKKEISWHAAAWKKPWILLASKFALIGLSLRYPKTDCPKTKSLLKHYN